MTRAASAYYLQDATQGEVAELLGLSRPKVGRLLKKARAERIVEITVHTHPALSLQLETELRERFGLRQALLVGDHAAGLRRNAVARATAASSSGRCGRRGRRGRDKCNVGAVADHVAGRRGARAPSSAPSAARRESTRPSANDICRRLAERLGGRAEGLYAPAYAESARARGVRAPRGRAGDARARRRRLRARRRRGRPRRVVRMGCFGRCGACGTAARWDILGSFFDVDGGPVAGGMEARVVGLDHDDLRRPRRRGPQRGAQAGGARRAPYRHRDVFVTASASRGGVLA